MSFRQSAISPITRESLRRAAAPCVELLEDRRFFTAFYADINFQPATSPVPINYVADTGAVYAPQSSGLSYGWNGPHGAQVTARKLRTPTDGVDNLYDTFATMHSRGRASLWQIAVPDGSYEVGITAGDPKATGRNSVVVNGSLFMDAKGTVKSRFVSAQQVISVSDGLIKLTVPKGEMAKLDFITISQVVTVSTTPPITTPPTTTPPTTTPPTTTPPTTPPTKTPTPTTTTEQPYTGTPFSTNQTIPAADYDLGGSGIAYHDTTAANLGGDNLRPGDAVDIQLGGTTGNVVGYTAPGEWLNYTISVPAAGNYVLMASATNAASGATFHGEVAGQNLTGIMHVPNDGSWTTFSTATSIPFMLSAGTQVLHISFDSSATNGAVGNFDWFKVAPAPTPPQPSTTITPLVWTTGQSAPLGLTEAKSIGVNGKLYVFGGFFATTPEYQSTTSAEAYDPATNTWATLAPMPVPAVQMGVATDGIYIYVVGGYTYNPKTTWQTFGTVNSWRYNIAANTWSAFVPLPAPRGAGNLELLDGYLHFFDGVDTQRVAQTTHWMLNLSAASPQWVLSTPTPFARNHFSSAVLDGKIYLMGGRTTGNDSSIPSADCIMWDPSNPGVWTSIASLPQVNSLAVAAVIDGQIFLAGGTTANYKTINTVIVYDPTTNKWSNQTSIPALRFAPCGGAVGNLLVVTTGLEQTLQTTTWVAHMG